MKKLFMLAAITFAIASCNKKTDEGNKNSKQATSFTIEENKKIASYLNLNDKQDYEDVMKGLVIPFSGPIKDASGRDVAGLDEFNFIKMHSEAPASVNPSLWRQAQLNKPAGIFQVTDRIFQARNMDLANMTIIQGNKGIILIDPLTSSETAKAALDLYFTKYPKKPIVAVIYTHSHIDHYGGVRGVISEEDAKSGKVKVIAPEGFLEEAISENVYAGTAMNRRALYQAGGFLQRNDKGLVDIGLGKVGSSGTTGLIAPNTIVKKTGDVLTVDGVKIVFQMAPGTEAPAEMLFYFPQFKALCASEDCTHSLHNLLTPRGAQVRDANKWWKTLDETIDLFGKDAQVMFASHHWPIWGNDRINTMLADQRDMYKYLNDHTLNLMNKGYTMYEVGDMVKLPESLDKKFYNRGYYGTIVHNAKAVYQRYLGFYSSNPADLHQLIPEDAAKKYVEYMGGANAVIKKAKEDFKKGNYRWVAQVMNQVVFADSSNREAKSLLADTYEQLAYQAESGPWRNEYLMGATELRHGIPNMDIFNTSGYETIKALTWEMLFDYMGIRLDVDKANGKKAVFNFIINDTKEKYTLSLENSVLIYKRGKLSDKADVTLSMKNKDGFFEVFGGKVKLENQIAAGKLNVSGDKSKLTDLMAMQDNFKLLFNIVTP